MGFKYGGKRGGGREGSQEFTLSLSIVGSLGPGEVRQRPWSPVRLRPGVPRDPNPIDTVILLLYLSEKSPSDFRRPVVMGLFYPSSSIWSVLHLRRLGCRLGWEDGSGTGVTPSPGDSETSPVTHESRHTVRVSSRGFLVWCDQVLGIHCGRVVFEGTHDLGSRRRTRVHPSDLVL